MKIDIKNEKGFMIIELILSTALLSILTLSISILLLTTINVNNRLSQKNIVIDENMLTINFIKAQIMSADKIKLNKTKDQLTVTDGTETSYFKFDSKKKQ